MNKQNKGLDKTSFVMIIVFAVIVVGGIAGILLSALGVFDAKDEEEISSGAELEATDTVFKGYETYEEIGDRFMEICRAGDVEAMYSIYYNRLLDDRYISAGVTKEEFDESMRDQMLHMTYFEEYLYGGDMLLETNSPAGYVNELYYRSYGETFPYKDVIIDDCVDIRAYFENGAFIDFMVAKVDGFWYAVS